MPPEKEEIPDTSEEDTDVAEKVAKETAAEGAAQKPPQSVPYDRFQKVNARLKELEAAQAAAEAAAKAAADEALAKNQEWQKLAEQRAAEIEAMKGVQEKATRYEEALKAQLETARDGLPDGVLKLLDTQDPAAQLVWLAENREGLIKQREQTPNINGGAAGKQKPVTSAQALDAVASKYGIALKKTR